MAGAWGVIASDTSAAGLTVSAADAVEPPKPILMVVEPVFSVLASPAVPVELLIVATVATVELH